MHAASSSFRPCSTAQMRAIKRETKVEEEEETAALCLHMQEMTSSERERASEGGTEILTTCVRPAVSKRLTGRKPSAMTRAADRRAGGGQAGGGRF